MKKYVRSDIDENVYDDCYEEVMEYVIQGMEGGEYWSYDDVVSDVYAGIQDYCYNRHATMPDDVEDKIYESVMEMLDTEGFIDHERGLLLYGN